MSNRLTFSLASLILILALGLVFAPMSVMAHPVTTDNNGSGQIHDGDAVGLAHTHPVVTVTIEDADDRTDGIQVTSTEADPQPDFTAAVDPKITFDVTLTVPVGAEDGGSAVLVGTFGATDVTAVAYNPTSFLPVGAAPAGGNAGDLTFGTWAQVPATDTESRVWRATATLTLANVPFATTGADADANAALTETAHDEAIAAAITAGIRVDVKLVADIIQTTGLVGGPMQDQGNLASTTPVTVIAPLDPNAPPTLTTTPAMAPPNAVTASTFDIMYSTEDTNMDDVTVAVSHTVSPPGAASHYTVDSTTTAGTVTVTQAPATATTMTIPAGTVIVTLTPNDGTEDGAAVMFAVSFTAKTYTAPNQLPTVTTTPATPPADAVTGDSFDIMYAGADADAGDTVMVAVTHAVAPTGAAAHYTVDSTTTAGTVTVTQATADATTPMVPAGTVTVTLTPNDGTDDGAAVTFAVSFTAKTYTAPTNTIAAGGYQVLVSDSFNAATLPGVTTVEVAGFPADLATFLIGGGTIDVVATGGDVIINEFMVARDANKLGALAGDPTDGQWIELYNQHATDAATGITVTFSTDKPAPAAPANLQDRLSNVVNPGWTFPGGLGTDVLNGSSKEGALVPFISIRRKETGKNGWTAGHWEKADASLLFATGRVGTPGGKNTVEVFKPVANTKPKRSKGVLISEVANRMNDGTEWIELVGPANKSLKNWRLSIATAVGTETNIFTFPNNDSIKISPNGYLVLTDQDPLNSELAAEYENGVPAPKRYKHVTLNPLPNNGNFVLILRDETDKAKVDSIQDIAGHANLSDDDPYTTLWPLTGDVGTLNSRNKLNGGHVYRRLRDNIDGYSQDGGHADRPAFGTVGFTGLGYDRNAEVTAENGGTPGYPHGNWKDNGANAVASEVVISEIMYGTGNGGPARNRNLSQWIEIHNMSDVNSLSLNDWRLEIVNSAYADADRKTLYEGKLRDSVNLSGTLPPNQTYLIVARRLGVSQHTRLPVERIRNAGKKFGEELLNPNGFYLTLKANVDRPAGEHKVIDTVGNLAVTPEDRRADSRSYSAHDWELSDLGHAINEDGTRISISRRHGAWSAPNTVATGTDMKGWILTSEDPRYSGIQQLTWYGRQDDHATPGYTIGAPLPVQLSTFRPTRLDDGSVVIRWVTESELNNAGFNILRSDTRDGQFTKLNTQLIAGQGTTSERTAYEWKDTTAKPNVVYYYQIQDVSIDGDIATLRTNRLRGHVSPTGKATTTWGQLKTLQ